MRRKAYPKYKDSGVAWSGEVPEHWAVKRGRFALAVNPSSPILRALDKDKEVSFIPMEAVGEYGGLKLDQTRVIEEVGGGYTEFQDGDVVVAKITPCFENGKGAMASALVNGAAYGTTELHVLRAFKCIDQRFLFYLTISDGFRNSGEAEMYGAGGQKRVPPEFCKDFYTPLPPINEQTAIADFLDRETGRLDTLIAKKQALTWLLKEKRTALISQTVTRGLPADAAREFGLEPHMRFKDTGIEWLGEIPEDWDLTPVRYAFLNQDYRRIPLAGVDRAEMEKLFPYYGASGIIDYVDNYLFDETLILVAEDGANLFSRSTPLAFLASGKYWVNNHAHILKPVSGDIKYWAAVLQTFDYTPLITGAAQPKLTADRLGSIVLPNPPEEEQNAIAIYIDSEAAKIDNLIQKVQAAIERLKEYRAALITAAVTGKIDVRHHASKKEAA